MERIIHGLSNEQYHYGDAERQYISSSQLKWLSVSPKYYRYRLDNPEPQTDAMRFGSLFHELMACSAEHHDNPVKALAQWFGGMAVFEPPVNDKTGQPYGTTTKAYKEYYEAFLQASEGKLIATNDEAEQVQRMWSALLTDCGDTSRQVCKLLKNAKESETSYFYEDENGIKLKVRPDLLTKKHELIDYKSTSLTSLDEESIARQIIQYGYHISLSMYQFVLHEITGKWYTPMLVFVQKTAPFDAVIVDISEWCYQRDEFDLITMGVGALEFKRLYDLLTECTLKNKWKGIEGSLPKDNKVKIMKPAVPAWYGMKILND